MTLASDPIFALSNDSTNNQIFFSNENDTTARCRHPQLGHDHFDHFFQHSMVCRGRRGFAPSPLCFKKSMDAGGTMVFIFSCGASPHTVALTGVLPLSVYSLKYQITTYEKVF